MRNQQNVLIAQLHLLLELDHYTCDLSRKKDTILLKLSFKINMFKIRGVNFASVNHYLFGFYASYILVDSTINNCCMGMKFWIPNLNRIRIILSPKTQS